MIPWRTIARWLRECAALRPGDPFRAYWIAEAERLEGGDYPLEPDLIVPASAQSELFA